MPCTNPRKAFIFLVLMRRIEHPTYWLRISCSTNWATSAKPHILPINQPQLLVQKQFRLDFIDTQLKKKSRSGVINQKLHNLHQWLDAWINATSSQLKHIYVSGLRLFWSLISSKVMRIEVFNLVLSKAWIVEYVRSNRNWLAAMQVRAFEGCYMR